jgi:hypothetical protein
VEMTRIWMALNRNMDLNLNVDMDLNFKSETDGSESD